MYVRQNRKWSGLSGLRGVRRMRRGGLGCPCNGNQFVRSRLAVLGYEDTGSSEADQPMARPTEIVASNPNPYYLPGLMSAPVYPGSGATPPVASLSPAQIAQITASSGGQNPWFPSQVATVPTLSAGASAS